MKLARPFFRLPLRFDHERLAFEARQLASHEWQPDRIGMFGYWSVPLVSHRGWETEEQDPPMAATPVLARCPYIRQVLAAFASPLAEVRLRRLAPSRGVPPHFDMHYHWFTRVRVHIPVVTGPAAMFTCDGETVHMDAGDAWLFDRLRIHDTHNGGTSDRVHLIVDTVGSPAFWRLVDGACDTGGELVRFDARRDPELAMETTAAPVILPPGDVTTFLSDLRARVVDEHEAAVAVALDHELLALDRAWRAAWVSSTDVATFRELCTDAYARVRAIAARSTRSSTIAQRLREFLVTGAIRPDRISRDVELGPQTRLELGQQMVFRMRPDATFEWTAGRERFGIDELTLVHELTRGRELRAAAKHARITARRGVRTVATLLDRGLLRPPRRAPIELPDGPPARATTRRARRVAPLLEPGSFLRMRPDGSLIVSSTQLQQYIPRSQPLRTLLCAPRS